MACFGDCMGRLLLITFWAFVVLLSSYLAFSLSLAIPTSIIIAALQIPGIEKAYHYVPAPMTVREISLSPAYCCHIVCFCDEVDDPKAEQCTSMQNRSEALMPSQCAASTLINSSSAGLCPPTGAAAVCNNGPFCCTSCNQTCASKPQPGCRCPCQQCFSCSCCKRVEGRLCRLFCDPCEKLHAVLDFKDKHGKAHTYNIDRNYTGESQVEGRDFYSKNPANSTFLAFYKPSDPTIVHFSRHYALSEWAVFVIFGGFPLFLVSVLITAYLLVWIVQSMGGLRRSIEKAVIMNWVLWVGIIWPFAILLPILRSDYTTPHARSQLGIWIAVLTCFGWLPLPLLFCLDSVISHFLNVL